jgi:RNA polymerase primary sigma factor
VFRCGFPEARPAWSRLSALEKTVLRLRYGDESRRFTPKEIADGMLMSAEGVREIEAKALRKLKPPSRSTRQRILRSFLDT